MFRLPPATHTNQRVDVIKHAIGFKIYKSLLMRNVNAFVCLQLIILSIVFLSGLHKIGIRVR